MMTTHYYTTDHPTAPGRKPVKGDTGYALRFPTDDGNEIVVNCGRVCLESFAEMLGSLLIDEECERDGKPSEPPAA